MSSYMFFNDFIRGIKPNLASSSVSAYASNLSMFFPHVTTEKSLRAELTMANIKTIVAYLTESYASPSTRGLKLNSLIIVLKYLFGDSSEMYIFVSKKRDECNQNYTENASKKQFTEKDSQNFVSTEEYRKMLDTWEPTVKSLMAQTKIKRTEFNQIQEFYLATFYFYKALRADLENTHVVFTKDVPADTSKNYVHVHGKSITIILNQYKTSKTYGQNTIEITGEGYDKILPYLNYLKNKTGENEPIVLFLSKDGKKAITASQLSQLYSSIFIQRLHKKFTITLNRKRIISSNPDLVQYEEAQKKVTKLTREMGTSVNMAQNVYQKKSKK